MARQKGAISVFHDDIYEIKTDPKFIKKLEKVIEIKILDLQGNYVMSFWKGGT